MLGAIAGDIAEASCLGVPITMRDEVRARLTDDLREVTDRFTARYMSDLTGDAS